MPTIITNIVYVLIFENLGSLNLIRCVNLFIYPNKSWFCGAILVYAIIYYFVIAKCDFQTTKIVMTIVAIVYLVYYIFFMDKTSFNVESLYNGGLARFSFYLFAMLCGLVYRSTKSKINDNGNRYIIIFSSLILFSITFVYKYLVNIFPALLAIQFVNQILTLGAAILLIRGLILFEDCLSSMKGKCVITAIANYFWEIYLVQTLVIPITSKMAFPINLLLTLLLVGIFSIMLKRATYFILQKIR